MLERLLLMMATLIMIIAEGSVAYSVAHYWVVRKAVNVERKLIQATLLAEKLRNNKRIVFMGDSITARWDVSNSRFLPGYMCFNHGVPSERTEQIFNRFEQNVISIKPAMVLILGGINDVASYHDPSMSEKNYESMVRLARRAGIEVFIGTLTPVRDSLVKGEYYYNGNARLNVLNEWIRHYCLSGSCTVVDFNRAFGGKFDPHYFVDDVHPNNEGYMLMEKEVVSALPQ